MAGKLLKEANFTFANRKARAYVLIGYPNDSLEFAEKRLIDTVKAGFMPHAMLYKADNFYPTRDWKKLQRMWARPAIISSIAKKMQLL